MSADTALAAPPTSAMLSEHANWRATPGCPFIGYRLFVIAGREGFTGEARDAGAWVTRRIHHHRPDLRPSGAGWPTTKRRA